MILTRPTAASQLVITPAHLFFKDQRTQAGVFDTWEVERTGLCGVQVERLASTDSWWPGGDDWPARAAGNIMEMEYWGSNGVYRRSTYARASEQAEVFTTLAFTFLIRKDVVYLTPSVKEGVYALPASGGQREVTPSGRLELVDDDHVFFTRWPEQSVWVISTDGKGERELLPAVGGGRSIERLLSDGSYLYFRRDRFVSNMRTVMPLERVPIAAGGPTETVTSVPWHWLSFAISGGFVYGHDDRQIVRVPKGGGDVEVVSTLGTDTEQLADVVLADDAMYWILNERRFGGRGHIWRGPRP